MSAAKLYKYFLLLAWRQPTSLSTE